MNIQPRYPTVAEAHIKPFGITANITVWYTVLYYFARIKVHRALLLHKSYLLIGIF